MSPRSRRHCSCQAFNVIELLMVIAILTLLGFLIFGGKGANLKGQAMATKCASNLQAIGKAFGAYAASHDGRYPYEHPDSLAYTNESQVWLHFQSLSHELGDAKLLNCPSDYPATARALDFQIGSNAGPQSLSTLKNQAVSYFVGLDAGMNPDIWLAGDARLEDTGRTRAGALLFVNDKSKIRWQSPVHDDRPNVLAVRNSRVYPGAKHLTSAPWPPNSSNRLLLPK